MGEVIGRLFREFAITLAVAILLSLLISLSLTPMMCARLLTAEGQEDENRFRRGAARSMQRLINAYDRALIWVLRHQGLTLLVAAGTLALTAGLYLAIPKGFFPQQDTGLIQAVTQGPQTASFTAMAQPLGRASSSDMGV